ncbi:uncharacterized protein LOC133675714 isoform X1 [Populus nigra]|uniref:uncharacterized protein LOC133675714 isoform X1 n=1 Tax=Populus nigra TaxID=3691 RepID=UPI002B26A7B5|nr:uncharacterized protein LOC133675714 isoform X1 [Populus nigra]
MNEELSGWKLAVSDVFRSEPDCSKLLCVMVGDRWCSNYRDGGSYYCLFSPWFHVASFNRDAADRDDSAVSISRHCGGLCCKMFVENHRRSFKLKNGVVQFLFPCPFDPLVLHFHASHSFRRVHGDTSRGHSIPSENKLGTN